jgi:hypothetical protein
VSRWQALDEASREGGHLPVNKLNVNIVFIRYKRAKLFFSANKIQIDLRN